MSQFEVFCKLAIFNQRVNILSDIRVLLPPCVHIAMDRIEMSIVFHENAIQDTDMEVAWTCFMR